MLTSMSTAQQQPFSLQAAPAVADTQADKCSSCQRFCALDLTYKCEACRQHWCIDCLAAHLRMYAALQPPPQPSGAALLLWRAQHGLWCWAVCCSARMHVSLHCPAHV